MSPGFLFWKTMSGVMGALPPSLADWIARGLGASAYYVWFTRRQVARENFARVLNLPPNDPRVGRVARRSFSNYTVYILNMMRYPQVTPEEFRRRVRIDVDPETRAVMMREGPLIIVSAHFGNMDYAVPVAVEEFRRITIAAEIIKPVELFEHLARLRSERGIDLIPYDRAPRKIIQALRRNEMVGFMIDLGINAHKDVNTIPIPFFGEVTNFPSSPAILAQRYGAPIIPAFARIGDHDEVHIEIQTPIFVSREIPQEQAERETMQRVAERIEKVLRAYPDQWYIFRPMWPTRPGMSARLSNRWKGAYNDGT